jgi:hypothetical protein
MHHQPQRAPRGGIACEEQGPIDGQDDTEDAQRHRQAGDCQRAPSAIARDIP